MSEWWAYIGGATLALATLPQAWRLLRTRDVASFGWTFSWMNLVGIGLLAARSWEIQEMGFFICNVITCAFWGLVLALKGAGARSAWRNAAVAPPVVGPPRS